MTKKEIEKEIRKATICIIILLFLAISNLGMGIINTITNDPFGMSLISFAGAVFPAFVAYKWVVIKKDWKSILEIKENATIQP